MPYQLFPPHSKLFFSELLPPGTVGWEWELILIILVSPKPLPLIFKEVNQILRIYIHKC